MAEKYAALGTQLRLGDGAASETFTTVASVMDISGPALTRDTEDVTTHDSPGGYEEFVSTIKRSGEVTFPTVWDPADPTHDDVDGLKAAYDDGDLHNFQITYPDADTTTQSFAALVVGLEHVSNVGGALIRNCTLKISGAVTEA